MLTKRQLKKLEEEKKRKQVIKLEGDLSDELLFKPDTMSIARHNKSYVWLVSLTDVIALILTFFVLLFSMKDPGQNHFNRGFKVLQGETGQSDAKMTSSDKLLQMKIQTAKKVLSLNYLEALLARYVNEGRVTDYAQFERYSEFVLLSWPQERLLSDLRSADTPLQELSIALSRVDNYIEVAQISKNNDNFNDGFQAAGQLAQILKSYGYNRDIMLSSQALQSNRDSDTINQDRLYLLIYNREDK